MAGGRAEAGLGGAPSSPLMVASLVPAARPSHPNVPPCPHSFGTSAVEPLAWGEVLSIVRSLM